MDYGKSAYLKVLDLEKELDSSTFQNTNTNSYLEIIQPNINQVVSKQNKVIVELPSISVEENNTICFQIKSTLQTNQTPTIFCELLVDDCSVFEEKKVLQSGENDFVVFKTFTPISTKNISVKIAFSCTDENITANLSCVSIIVLGVKGNSFNAEIELRAIELTSMNKTLISYIDTNKLYYTIQNLEPNSLKASDFQYLQPATSHSFCLENFEDNNELINLYRTDSSGNLYYSKPFEDGFETLIDKNVSMVHSCISPKITDTSNLIVYIKNGNCYYCIKTNSDNFTTSRQLNLPAGKYTDIRAVSNKDSDYVYVIATHENGSNYIIRSSIEVSTGKLIENIDLSYKISVTRYIDLSIVLRKSVENLNVNITPIIKAFYDYNSIFNRVSVGNINMTYNLQPSKYTVDFDGIYGVKLDKSIMTAGLWESYTDDAEGLEGAYMDFTNNVFIDNGWTERWPFNKIKPCLVKNGEVVGYLNPNDYTVFEDGTKAGITNRSNGNVMIEIPKIYYKLASDENYITVQISRKAREGFTDRAFWHNGNDNSKIYVGAYLSGDSYLTSRGFYSISGSLLTDLYTINHVDHYKYNKGTNEEFLPFNVVTLLQCLYLIMFKNTNSQVAIGYGWNNLKTNYKTGQMNTKGLYYGKKSGGSGVKIFGIEDFYGVKMTIVTGFYVDSSGNPRFIDVYDKNSSYNPSYFDSYITTNKEINFSPTSYFNLIDIVGENEIGFVNTSSNKDYTTGFTDSSYPRKGSNSLIFGTTKLNNQYGIFNTEAILPSSKDSRRSIRLVYFPDKK